MAKRQITELIDDLDGTALGTEGESLTFSLDGSSYDIDLSPANADKLREALAPYIKAGRKLGRGATGAPSSPRRRANNSDDLNAIRAWARDNGHTVSDRGRIAASVVEAYQKANG